GAVLALAIAALVNQAGLTWIPPGNATAVPLKLDVAGRAALVGGAWLGLAVVTTLAALLPANRAARLPVVDALRHVCGRHEIQEALDGHPPNGPVARRERSRPGPERTGNRRRNRPGAKSRQAVPLDAAAHRVRRRSGAGSRLAGPLLERGWRDKAVSQP